MATVAAPKGSPVASLAHVVSRLVAPDAKARAKGRGFLKAWLQMRKKSEDEALSYVEYLQLWKALYYGVWLTDGVPESREVCIQLCKLLRPEEAVVSRSRHTEFLAAFLTTLHNNWDTLDRWRIQKYETWIRMATADLVFQMQSAKWDPELVMANFTAWVGTSPCLVLVRERAVAVPVWFKESYRFQQTMKPNGITLQFTRYFLEEVRRQAGEGELRIGTEESLMSLKAFAFILTYFIKLLGSESTNAAVISSIGTYFFDVLLQDDCLSADSKEVVFPLVGTVLFKVAACKSISLQARDLAEKHILGIDNYLESKSLQPIDYAKLAASADFAEFDRFPDTFEFLSEEGSVIPLAGDVVIMPPLKKVLRRKRKRDEKVV